MEGASEVAGQSRRVCLAAARRLKLRLSALFIVIILSSIAFGASGLLVSSTSHAQAGEQFLPPDLVVPLSDRLVCSLLGNSKTSAGIVGMDGGHTVKVGDTGYWTFGDTLLNNGWMIPNSIAWSTDTDASDCVDLTPKQSNGRAVPLLELPNPEKLTVWPVGMEETAPGTVHFYYASVVPDPTGGWHAIGTGIASFDTATLTGTPALGGSLVWKEGSFGPSRTVTDDTYVYVLLDASRSTWTTDTILARVPRQSFASPSAYEYWDAGGPDRPARWIGGLWNAASGSWNPAINDLPPLWRQLGMHNGVDIAYNEFLGKWLAVYTTAFMTSFNARVADDLTGPWSTHQSVLVDCLNFHQAPSQEAPFVCYTGSQHEFYARDGGRTIYVTYSNSETYQVYLHEIRLAAPINQWIDPQGRPVYQPRSAPAPAGFTAVGTAFYASDIPAPGQSPIHRWEQATTGDVRYAAIAPATDYVDKGIAFYAPLVQRDVQALHASYDPVSRWTNGSAVRYSALNLAPAGYAKQETAFYSPCLDSDRDTLTDCTESFLGTDASALDSDGDGLLDGYEQSTPGCDPAVFNESDRDGIEAQLEILSGTNPCRWDSGAWGCAHGELRDPGCDVDTDGDGCSDAAELGPDPRSGGRRNPANPWDFYDVNGDHVISMRGDLLPVFVAVGMSAGPNYSRAKDRRPPPSPLAQPDPSRREAWDLGPPDGVIAFSDILGVARQFGHSCARIP